MSKRQTRQLVLLGIVLALVLFAVYLVLPSFLERGAAGSSSSLSPADRRATFEAESAIIEACSREYSMTAEREQFNLCLTANGVATPAP